MPDAKKIIKKGQLKIQLRAKPEFPKIKLNRKGRKKKKTGRY